MSYFGIPIRNGLPIGLGSVAPLASGGGSPFSPLSLFSGGAPGAWYDPSDLTTLFQDSAGTTPVTAVEQPVGLMLDKSQGLVLGSDVVVNGTFTTDTGWIKGTGVTISGGLLNFASVSNNSGATQGTIPAGKWYRVQFTVSSISAGAVKLQIGSTLTGSLLATTGTYTGYVYSGAGAGDIEILSNGTTTASIDNISVKELAGNHAFQATSASRPVLSARYNLLTKTEDLTNAAWNSNTTVTVSPGVTDPEGGTTAFTVTANGASSRLGQLVAISGAMTQNFWIRRRTGTGVVNYFAGVAYVALTGLTTEWQQYSVATVPNTVTNYFILQLITSGDAIDVWHPDLRVANNGITQPNYQRVNTATDYATTGFLPYLKFDGVDDSLSTNSISFTSTDKMSVFAGVRKLSTSTAVIFETSTTSPFNDGTFGVFGPDSANQYTFLSRGSASTIAATTSSLFAAPITNTLTGLGNISGDLATLRVNGAQVAQSTADQGTGNFGNYPLYIGRRNNASLPFNGQMYSMIIVGKAVTAGELSSTETYVNQKTGAY